MEELSSVSATSPPSAAPRVRPPPSPAQEGRVDSINQSTNKIKQASNPAGPAGPGAPGSTVGGKGGSSRAIEVRTEDSQDDSYSSFHSSSTFKSSKAYSEVSNDRNGRLFPSHVVV